MRSDNTIIKINHSQLIGSLFLLAFVAYGFGKCFFENESCTPKLIGSFLITVNSIIVFTIGFLLKKTLNKYSSFVANTYLITRILEGIFLSSVLLTLLPSFSNFQDFGYFLAMLILGLGSVPMCYIFYKNRVLPRWLSVWGMIGYLLFAFGFFMELVGQEWSMYFLVIAGFWEITFGIWLIVKKTNS